MRTLVRKLLTLLFLAAPALPSIAVAANKKPKDEERIIDANTSEKKKRVRGTQSGLSVILGGEYGISKAKPSMSADFDQKSGRSLELKALADFLFREWMIDTGVGWYFQNLRGPEHLVFKDNPISGDRDISLSGILLEFTPSYRLTNNLFVSAITQLRTPAAIDYFSESNPNNVGFAVGAQLGLQIFDSDLNSRFVLKALTHLGLKEWSDVNYLAGVQFGLPIRQPDALIISKTTTVNKIKDVVEYRKKDFTITITANVIKLALDNILTFYIDAESRPTLTAEAQSFLVDLGSSLQSSLELWEGLRIDAQTPAHIGPVHDSLISIGVPASKIRKGKATREIADGGNASVDFTFFGVKDSNSLAESIRNAMRSMKIPENCQRGGTCE